jgi:glycosyltransferase involved in cell wall biosynthesis
MISIIIPTYNEEKVIGQSLEALKSRLTIPYEIIVSDGKSTDRTVEIARQYTDKVFVYSGTVRQNISQGRNAGAKEAVGEFLVFMDADARIADPDILFAKAFARFETNPKLVALTTRLKVFPDQETFGDKIMFGFLNFNLRFLNNVLHRGESTGEFQMIKRDVFESLGGFREDLITREDGDMFLRLSKVGLTMLDPNLAVFHSGRRAHKTGWPRLLYTWMINVLWVVLFDKAHAEEWEEIR